MYFNVCVCVCVCVCVQVSYTILSFGREGTPKFGVMLRECIALNNYGGLGVRSPVVVDFFLIDALRLILRHSGGTSSQF